MKKLYVAIRVNKYKLLSECPNVIGKPYCYHPLLLMGKGRIIFGKNIQVGVVSSPNFYSHYSYIEARNDGSEIRIGDNVALNNAFSAVAFSLIEIGDNVVIGVNCSIIDNDGHDLAIDKRAEGTVKTASVHIFKNVFIGSNVVILKGVSIGENSVIGNGSVVSRDIPANVVAAGNPARIIRNLE